MSLATWAELNNAAKGIDEPGKVTAERILSDIRRAQKAMAGPYEWADILDLDFMHALDIRLHDPLTDRWVRHCVPYNVLFHGIEGMRAVCVSLQMMVALLDKPTEDMVQA